jgi:hypothetical protein
MAKETEPVGVENGIYRYEGKVILPSGKEWTTGATGMHGARQGLVMQAIKIRDTIDENGGDSTPIKTAIRDFKNVGLGPIMEKGGKRTIDLDNGKSVTFAIVPCRQPIEDAPNLGAYAEPSWMKSQREAAAARSVQPSPRVNEPPRQKPRKPRDQYVEGVNVSEVARKMGKAARKTAEGRSEDS